MTTALITLTLPCGVEPATGADPVTIEYTWVGAPEVLADPQAPVLVILHEGLGSVAMWRDFPQQLAQALGMRGLVYSRPGYGRSTPRPADRRWRADFMHRHAIDVLPALMQALAPQAQRYWLFGHSDGGSIALIHAASCADRVAGCIVMAPHILVEDISLRSIREARHVYQTTELRSRLAKYHDDVDSAFYGWNDVWLHEAFPAWSIEALLPQILCPVLAIQGEADDYGTMLQIDGIAAAKPDTELCKLSACGHSPHRDQPAAVIDACSRFVTQSAGS